ncbi:arsenate reductase/protein-tyrosine-phosphatase family protein [Brevibacillus sp. SAFN-007a]|uniref:arsenate reductase/protein-tyrosine-phosphatase family protein n=1 Tax=Brevibacillus sp. SAFN-007a TaxID=3436862 RepID=UPI003F7E53F4
MLGNKKIIYFLCTGNSCRSQMAEGFTRHYFGEDFAIYSGGLYAKGVHPLSIKVMQCHRRDIIDPGSPERK